MYHPPPSSAAGPSMQRVEAIPHPTRKVDYEPPVFRTFQDRKRAKEMALRLDPETPRSRPLPASPGVPSTSQQVPLSPLRRHPALPPQPAPLPFISQHLLHHPLPPHLPPASVVQNPYPSITTPPQPPSSATPTAPMPMIITPPTQGFPVQATIERSDTISSIRSLDAPMKRPLPRPPVGVYTSKSLDRGIPVERRRKQPSVVHEEEEIPAICVSEDEPKATTGLTFSGLPVISVSSESAIAPSRVQSDSAILCAGCGAPIIGRIVNAMKRRFHPECFRCAECGEHLEHVSSFEWEGRAYCHLDYHDKFAHRCHHCKTPIVDPRFVTLNDEVLGQRYYHELHFFCSECGDPFLDPSGGEVEETNAFVIQKGHPYCERCHLRLHKPKCKACTKPIADVAVNAMGAKWHAECFVCQQCKGSFANNLFFPKDGLAYCTECYEGM